ncbi:hypothetical protein NMY22_g9164 [Coprinellus aureogranulatus]|nr:hypothetical protein NMY22_g9164 [Coprinellus aureogranulatus]
MPALASGFEVVVGSRLVPPPGLDEMVKVVPASGTSFLHASMPSLLHGRIFNTSSTTVHAGLGAPFRAAPRLTSSHPRAQSTRHIVLSTIRLVITSYGTRIASRRLVWDGIVWWRPPLSEERLAPL